MSEIEQLRAQVENLTADYEHIRQFQDEAEADRRRADWLLGILRSGALRHDGVIPETPLDVLDLARTTFGRLKTSEDASKPGKPLYSGPQRDVWEDAFAALEDIVAGRQVSRG